MSRRWREIRTLLALVVLEGFESLEAGGTGDQLVRELALVLLFTVDLAVRVVGVIYIAS